MPDNIKEPEVSACLSQFDCDAMACFCPEDERLYVDHRNRGAGVRPDQIRTVIVCWRPPSAALPCHENGCELCRGQVPAKFRIVKERPKAWFKK